MNTEGLIIEIVSPYDIENWDQIILDFPNYSIFHSSSWLKVLAESYGYIPLALIVKQEEKIEMILPLFEVKSFLTRKRGVSLPFTDFCDPLSNNDNLLEKGLLFLSEYGRNMGWKYYEIRIQNLNIAGSAVSESFLTHDLDLKPDEELIRASFRSSTNRNINSAVKAGVKVQIYNTYEALEPFYLLHCQTRKKHGLPPQPFIFFKNLFKNIIEKDNGIIILASYNSKVIAGGIFLNFAKTAIYKYGASDTRYQYLRANNLIFWEAIKALKGKGCTVLNFGKTNPGNKGLMQFKNGWGVEENKINYFKYNFKQEQFIESKMTLETGFQNVVFRKMPVSLLRFLGSILYKHTA